jgi:tetratricopeptide (TPR) repeat protein
MTPLRAVAKLTRAAEPAAESQQSESVGVGRQPYPGLRPFQREETDLFFGREDCVNSLVALLADKHFLAVLGSSGSGKSSLVRTGLLDALELGLMGDAGSRWRIVEFRPGGKPIANLAAALLRSKQNSSSEDQTLLQSFLTRGPRSVIEWCGDGHLRPGENLLLLVDQFEELFRYQEYEGREEAEAFVALLLASSRSSELPIYVTLTMRSEYLGACALIEGLAERMNEGQFLTPRMTREQCRTAIEGPAGVCCIEIEPALVNRLLNDLTDFAPWERAETGESMTQLDRLARRADQLPLLQHALNRMWALAVAAVEPADTIVLRLTHYEEIGGVQGALDRHADEVLDALGARGPLAQPVFRTLTSGSSAADAIRRPVPFRDLVTVCGGNEADAREVVEAFRAPGRNFLLPENNVRIEPGTTIDISHESLIRQWRRLSGWVESEARDAQQWRRLTDAAELEASKQGGLLQGLNLQTLLEWRKSTKPAEAWANRYSPARAYAEAISFLERSQEAARAAIRRKQVARFSMVFAFIGLAFAGMLAWQRIEETQRRKMTDAVKQAIQSESRQVDDRVRSEIEKTLNLKNPTLSDVKVIFDNALSGYMGVPRSPQKSSFDANDRKAASRKVIDIFVDVYSNRVDTTSVAGRKPFAIFDLIGQFLNQDEMWNLTIETLGNIAKSYVQSQNFDVAVAALQQGLESAQKKDRSLRQFAIPLMNMVDAAKGQLAGSQANVTGPMSVYTQCFTILQTLERSNASERPDEVRAAIADTYEAQGDLYANSQRIPLARQAYQQAIRDYWNARAKSGGRQTYADQIQNLTQKIKDLRG